MKLIKLRFVTLALLLVLSFSTAYAGGSVGNNPALRNHHGKHDGTPLPPVPPRDTKPAFTVPQDDDDGPGNPDDKKPVELPNANPAVPAAGQNVGPVPPVPSPDTKPNRRAAVLSDAATPAPATNPNQAVPAAGQNDDDAPGNPNDKKRARRVLNDAAVPAAGQKGGPAPPVPSPDTKPNRRAAVLSDAATPAPATNPNQAVPAAGQNDDDAPGDPDDKKVGPAHPNQNAGGGYVQFTLQTRTPQNDKDKVFKYALVPPFDPNTNPTIRYVGQMMLKDGLLYPSSNSGKIQYYDANNKVVEEDIGTLIGGGANSQVYYNSNNPNYVNKVVSLNGGLAAAAKRAAVIMDQNGGRVLLNKIKEVTTQSKLFMVAQQKENKQEVIIYDAPNLNGEYRFLITREENIASEVKTLEGNPVKDLNNITKTASASNAQQRVNKRKQGLNEAESLTINLVIRDLNDRGIVWTDLKLANLDIVKDEESPTGYRVIFFDFDGFRPLRGEDPAKRAAAARDIQKAFDAPRLLKSADGGWDVMSKGVKDAIRKHYKSEQDKQLDQIKVDEAFDFTAFNDVAISTLATPSANSEIPQYHFYNLMDEKQFIEAVAEFNKKNKRTVTYNPANLKPKI